MVTHNIIKENENVKAKTKQLERLFQNYILKQNG